MAHLAGPLKFTGSLGDFSSYTDKNGKIVFREKGGASKERFKEHPQMELTRNNAREFGGASSIAGRIRQAFRLHNSFVSDTTYFNRLVALVSLISKTDFVVGHGERSPFRGNLLLLKNFQWNAKIALDDMLNTPFTASIDAVTGSMSVNIPSFIPGLALKAPVGATHFQLIARGAAIHPEEASPDPAMSVSPLFTMDDRETSPLSFSLTVPTGIDQGLLLLGLSIIFYRDDNGIPYALRGGASALVSVEKILRNAEESDEWALDGINLQDGILSIPRPDPAPSLDEILEKVAVAPSAIDKRSTPIFTDDQDQQRIAALGAQRRKTEWLRLLDKYRYGW